MILPKEQKGRQNTVIDVPSRNRWSSRTEVYNYIRPGRIKIVMHPIPSTAFFYIAAMNILADEFKGAVQRWARYTMAVLGFAIMVIVATWT